MTFLESRTNNTITKKKRDKIKKEINYKKN